MRRFITLEPVGTRYYAILTGTHFIAEEGLVADWWGPNGEECYGDITDTLEGDIVGHNAASIALRIEEYYSGQCPDDMQDCLSLATFTLLE